MYESALLNRESSDLIGTFSRGAPLGTKADGVLLYGCELRICLSCTSLVTAAST